MKRSGNIAIVFVLLVCGSLVAGDLRVNGPVEGVWTTGSQVFIDGPCSVLAGTSLIVESGVEIFIETEAPFVIEGAFEARGVAGSPILITPTAEWGGFRFRPAGINVRRLHWVVVDGREVTPSMVIVGDGAMLDIESCSFEAVRSCVDVNGGRLWLRFCKLQTSGLFSQAVKIERLLNDIPDPCDHPNGNKISDNLVSALVEPVGGELPPTAFTTALYVDGSSNTCIHGNTFVVRSSGVTVGTYFGDADEAGSAVAEMDRCNITVRSVGSSPRGIFNANQGSLRVLRCNVDVAKDDPDSPYYSVGVCASSSADVMINSSNIVIDRGDNFFVSLSGGVLAYDFNTRWSNSGNASPNGIGDRGDESELEHAFGDPQNGLIPGDHNIDADPMWRMEGVWGDWATLADVRMYYSLLPGSPCIDAADTLLGRDEDNSAPDIGAYPFEGLTAGEPRTTPVASELEIGMAYPNPFNLSTVIPFRLGRSADIQVAIFDVLGRLVYSDLLSSLSAGNHELNWNAVGLASGTYMVSLGVANNAPGLQRVYLIK